MMTMSSEPMSLSDLNDEADTTIRDKIIAVLRIYPKLSHSMLQCGIGSSLPASLWRPVLEELVRAGKVVIDHEVHMSGSGRSTSYSIIHLVGEV